MQVPAAAAAAQTWLDVSDMFDMRACSDWEGLCFLLCDFRRVLLLDLESKYAKSSEVSERVSR